MKKPAADGLNPEELEEIIAAYKAGATMKSIAAEHFLAEQKVKKILIEAGVRDFSKVIKHKKRNQPTRDEVIHAMSVRPTLAAAALHLNISPSKLRQLIDEYSLRESLQ